MKHLLIIFSILLLSSPVIGNSHKGETLYRWETSSVKVWKGFGEKGTHPIYKKEITKRLREEDKKRRVKKEQRKEMDARG